MRPSRTVTVSLPPDLAREVDKAARSEGRSRSEMFREALRQYLARLDRWERIFAYGEQVAARTGLTEEGVARVVKARRRAAGRGSRRR
ncbi:MAG: ribbon-helix-helix protein, CopG family [Actinomycetota bacterium]